MPPTVVGVLLNWRQPELTLQCMTDIADCGEAALSLLVIDNGSGDGSSARLAAGPGDFTLLSLESNVGYCAAINRGLAWARERDAEFVLLLNNDLRLQPGFLAPMVRVLRNDPGIACVGPTMLRTDGRAWCQGGALAFHPNMLRLRGLGEEPAPLDAGPEAVDFMPGACALYRLSALADVGDLDESYFMYWEDVDLGQRLRDRGWTVLWLPWVRVVHASSASSGGGRSPMRKYMSGVNSVHYLRRHGRPRDWLAFAVFEVVLWPLTWVGGTGWAAMMAKARGILAGIRGQRVTARDVERYLGRGVRSE